MSDPGTSRGIEPTRRPARVAGPITAGSLATQQRPRYGPWVPDAIFAHPRLAAVYDAFDGVRDDLTAYLAIVRELRAGRVVDIG